VERVDNVGIELKGRHTRTMLKKSWKIKFGKFVKGTQFVGLKKISIKYPFPDTTSMRGQLTGEFLRAMKIPVSRSRSGKTFILYNLFSFAALWINGIHWGLYWLHEEHDKPFLKARFKDHGNLYKCGVHAFLEYAGSDPNTYENMTYEAFQFMHHMVCT
jgi:spore coat protein CotH